MKGVAPKTEEVLNRLSGFDCIKEFTLIGGTALSISPQYNVSASEIEIFLRPYIQSYYKKTLQRKVD